MQQPKCLFLKSPPCIALQSHSRDGCDTVFDFTLFKLADTDMDMNITREYSCSVMDMTVRCPAHGEDSTCDDVNAVLCT